LTPVVSPTPEKRRLSIQRPAWLPSHLPELDGLRGFAILAVVLYHCTPRLVGTWIYGATLWGWAGVSLFFAMSGFLITCNLLGTRDKPRYFHNFHARRALRIWPIYVLLLVVVYLNSEWFIGPPIWEAVRHAPWLAYLFCVQNLFHLTLPPAIGPTWALAIEEQYYFLWAPVVRWLRRPWMLALFLAAAVACPPIMRGSHHTWITPTHTLTHLDGLALGSLLALGLYTLPLSRQIWLRIGLACTVAGFTSAHYVPGRFLDSAIATGFVGAVLAAVASTGARNPLNTLLRRGPLPFYGKISYGLYMFHISLFIYFGGFDARMDRDHPGIAGNLAVVALRIAVSTAVAAALWYGFESKILKLKRHL
jgi:peptidoglycan/LPS O-acetylase OafA/YrhL